MNDYKIGEFEALSWIGYKLSECHSELDIQLLKRALVDKEKSYK